MSFIESLQWRYATKRMNGQQIPEETLGRIVEAVRLAPSSFGLTPYNVFLIKNPELKAQLLPHCYNQPQINESSALLVFAPWKNITENQVDEYMNEVAATRNIPVEALKDFASAIKGRINSSNPDELHNWAAKQAYIALGFGLAAAAVEKVDSTPMEGFNAAGVNQVLGLEEKGMSAVCILALGYRDAEKDYLSGATKVRRKKEILFIEQ